MNTLVRLSRYTPRYAQRVLSTRCMSMAAAAAFGDGMHPDMTEKTRNLANVLTTPDHHAHPQEERRLRNQRRFALARAITLVESSAPAQRRQGDLLLTHLLGTAADNGENSTESSSFRVGIAGPPGAGKSTFIEAFGQKVLNKEFDQDDDARKRVDYFSPNKLAVVCIDPSSSVTGGSILGDKTRMMELSRHDRAYVRPSANGGTFGGLSAYTHDVVSLCQAADYDLVIVESVGLGQSEVEIAESVDMLILVVPPGGGDELQGVKKGIVEVADMLIINKADGNLFAAARSTGADYKSAMKFLRPRTEHWRTPVLLTSAYTGDGLEKVWKKIKRFRELMIESGELETKRHKQNRYWMWKNLKDLISAKTRNDPVLRQKADAMEEALRVGAITPRVAASELLDSLMNNGKS